MKKAKTKKSLSFYSYKFEDFLYSNNIKIRLKKNKSSCLCEIHNWFIKNRNGKMKQPLCKGKSLMEAFIKVGNLISKQKIYPLNPKEKPIKVPKISV